MARFGCTDWRDRPRLAKDKQTFPMKLKRCFELVFRVYNYSERASPVITKFNTIELVSGARPLRRGKRCPVLPWREVGLPAAPFSGLFQSLTLRKVCLILSLLTFSATEKYSILVL